MPPSAYNEAIKIGFFRRPILQPAIAFCGAWLFVALLYQMKFSYLLIYGGWQVFWPTFIIITGFFVGSIPGYFFSVDRNSAWRSKHFSLTRGDLASIEKRLNILLISWLILSILEIIYSGGLPLFWLFTGSSKTYFDFGIPSLHGLLNAVISACTLVSFLIAPYASRSIYRYMPALLFIWAIIAVTRNLIIVNGLQILFLYALTKRSFNPKNVIGLFVLLILSVIIFGWVGDARSGATAFLGLARPSNMWPSYLPSGFFWVYIYLTTPLNNLVHQMNSMIPEWNWTLMYSTSTFFPSVVRDAIYGENHMFRGDLVQEAFNVSTAFSDLYRDIGYYGLAFLSFIIGYFSIKFWNGRNIIALFFLAVMMQNNVLSIFFNNYFYLPVIFQFAVLAFILRGITGVTMAEPAK